MWRVGGEGQLGVRGRAAREEGRDARGGVGEGLEVGGGGHLALAMREVASWSTAAGDGKRKEAEERKRERGD